MWNHLRNQCLNYPDGVKDKRQKLLSFSTLKNLDHPSSGKLLVVGFNKETCRNALSKMIVLDELPFKFVQGEGYKHFLSVACPRFSTPSRKTIARDIFLLYLNEAKKFDYMCV